MIKYKRGEHPNSQANLNIWEKGKSGNPDGRPNISKRIKKITESERIQGFQKGKSGNPDTQWKKGQSGNPKGRASSGILRVYLAYYKAENKYISKIGITSNFSARRSSLQSSSPKKLSFIKFEPTFYAFIIEQRMLRIFKEYNFRGEWFKMQDCDFRLLISYIEIISNIFSKDTISNRLDIFAQELIYLKKEKK